ncbi:MAG: polysaccharide biosynthesis C-terminal domain-containing protein [Acidobacteriia bacterium]|nr:polysaccharide biosynthesis C-terminal domain-containing protein [Terriglobia bacterium]
MAWQAGACLRLGLLWTGSHEHCRVKGFVHAGGGRLQQESVACCNGSSLCAVPIAPDVWRLYLRSKGSGTRVGFASVLARSVYIVPASALMYVVLRLMGLSAQYFPALGLLALMMVVRGAAENVAFIFQGGEDQISSAKVGVSQSAVTLLATLAICLTSKNLLLLIAAHVLGGFVSAVYGFVLLRSKGGHNQEFGGIFDEARSLLGESHWLNAGTFVASVYNRVDVLLLRRMLTSEAVAIYAAPYRILDLTQIVPASLIVTILPSLCRTGETNSGIMHPRRAIRFLLVIAVCLVVMATMAAPWVTLLLFGQKYHDSVPVLQILIWATVPMYWNFVLNAELIANSFDRAILYAASIALMVNVGFNLLLIPKFGYLACAAVTLITEFALLGANLHFISRIGAAAWPENLGRLTTTTILVAGFCFCWTRAGAGYGLTGAVLLICAFFSLPLFRSDFSTPVLRSGSTKPVTGIIG